MSKNISNNNNTLKATSIDYSSFVRIAQIVRPTNISFKLQYYFYDDTNLYDKKIINYNEDIYSINYIGKKLDDKEDYTASKEDFILIRNTNNCYSIRCAIEIYNNKVYLCVPSQGLYNILFNNFTDVPLQIFQTNTKEHINSEDNLIKETIGRNTFKDVDWIVTDSNKTIYLKSLLNNYSRVIKLILINYSYQTNYINIDINGGNIKTIYANIDGPINENNIYLYIENNRLYIKIDNAYNYRIGVIYDSGKYLNNEVREFYRIKRINESEFDDTKLNSFIKLPHKNWIYDSNAYKYIKSNNLIYDTNLKKVIVTGTNRKDVFGKRYDYPYLNTFSSIIGSHITISIINNINNYVRKNAVIIIEHYIYRISIYNNNNNLEFTIISNDSNNLLSFYNINNTLYLYTNYSGNFNIIILSADSIDIVNDIQINEENKIDVTINDIGGTDLDGAEVTNVETLEPTQEATATATIADNKVKFTFAIPRGRDGQNGAPGKDGVSPTLPDYSIYRYCKSDSKPAAPTGTSQNPSGWVAIPNDTGNWWQCVGQVNGATGAVTEWGEVLPLNGRDGTAQDGRYTELRYAKNSNRTTAPVISTNVRTPSGWSITPPTVNVGEYLWMTTAIINPNDTLYTNWSSPVCISGPQGVTGATGPAGNPGKPGSMGPAGIPGNSIIIIYCGGTSDSPDADLPSIQTDTIPDGWSETIADSSWDSGTDPDYSLATLWALQGKIVYENSDGTDYHYEWQSKPYISNGAAGGSGQDGKDAQIVYPAGVYNVNTTYITTDKVAPYVLDEADGNYYVLNAEMTWIGTQHDNLTPHEDYTINNGKYWLKFDGFNAVYAKIGIIANGLIGSAVFNGDWMFSQQGIDANGSFSIDYKNFDASNPFLSTNSFRPNIAINFRTGATYFSCGKVQFNIDGSGQLANGNIEWNSNGDVTVEGMLSQGGTLQNNSHVTLPAIPTNSTMEFAMTFNNITRLSSSFTVAAAMASAKVITCNYDAERKTTYSLEHDNTRQTILLPYGIGFVKFIGIDTNATNRWYIEVHNFGMPQNVTDDVTGAYCITPYVYTDKVITPNS